MGLAWGVWKLERAWAEGVVMKRRGCTGTVLGALQSVCPGLSLAYPVPFAKVFNLSVPQSSYS